MRLHKEGHLYALVATLLFIGWILLINQFASSWVWLSVPLYLLGFLLWFWVFWFFRIPARKAQQGKDLIMSPCDGKVVVIEETEEPEYFQGKRLQVSIFMSPLNVHVNRYPVDGQVVYAKYHPGKYLVAWHPKSSTENERSTVVIRNERLEVLMRQIAGAVARRIVTYAKNGDQAMQNAEMGFIKFGSRVDLFLPVGSQICVKIGDVVKGETDIIARI